MNKEQLQKEFEEISRLQKVYKDESKILPNSREAIDAYLNWYNKVYTVCRLVFGAEDADVIAFGQVDNSENGYGLVRNFDQLGRYYTMLQYRLKMYIDNVNDAALHTQSKNESRDELPPLIFISHASADKEFASALVTLLEQQGFTRNEIFCSSVEGYGFDVGDDIYTGLLEKFHKYRLFVLFIHSPRFYQSKIALNEMGAAWALRSQYNSILTPDINYDGMKGVVTDHDVAVKVNVDDAQYRMTQLMNKIRMFFGRGKVDGEVWERHRNEFLAKVNNLHYSYSKEYIQQEHDFTDEQIERLKKWTQSEETELFIITYKDGGEIEMGDSYSISNAEDEVEWRDFIEKLEEMGLIKRTGRYQDDEPIYRRTRKLNEFLSDK